MTKQGMSKVSRKRVLCADGKRPDHAGSMCEKAWGSEAKRRLVAMRSGRMRSYSLAQVFAKYKP